MPVEIKIPESGESISEVQIGEWRKSEGDSVERDEILVEIETDKASMELPAPAGGILVKITKNSGDSAEVGDVIGEIEEGDGQQKRRESKKSERRRTQESEKRDEVDEAAERKIPKAKRSDGSKKRTKGEEAQLEKDAEGENAEEQEKEAETGEKERVPEDEEEAQVEQEAEDEKEEVEEAEPDIPEQVEVKPRVMPGARRALGEHGLRAADVEGAGPAGRVTKEDVQQYVKKAPNRDKTKVTDGKRRLASETNETARKAQPKRAEEDREEEIVPMTTLRRRIAKRLVQAQHTAALLTTFNEIEISNVIALRERYGEAFKKRFEIKLGFMSFFVKAAVEALKRIPQVNAEIRDEEIVYRNYYDIGVAVATDHGLVVPVIQDADRLGFAEIERTIADFAERARNKKLTLEELQGGTFTISNGGVYGSLLSTPIVNPPQSGILGLHAIQERPVARDNQVVIRPMMYVALTYDHRLIDGREAVAFLIHIKESIETPSKLLLEI